MFKGSREFLFPTSISFKKFLWTFRFLSLILRDSSIFFLRNFARKIGKPRARFDPLTYARRLTTVLTVRIFRKGQEKEQDTTYILQETEVISEFVSEFFPTNHCNFQLYRGDRTHLGVSPNGLFLLSSTCIKRSLEAELLQ